MVDRVILSCKKWVDGEYRPVSWDEIDMTIAPKVEIKGVEFIKVVRCKDCKHFNDGDCTEMPKIRSESDYCSWGERKESEE